MFQKSFFNNLYRAVFIIPIKESRLPVEDRGSKSRISAARLASPRSPLTVNVDRRHFQAFPGSDDDDDDDNDAGGNASAVVHAYTHE